MLRPAYNEVTPTARRSGLLVAGWTFAPGGDGGSVRLLPDACDYLMYDPQRGLCVLTGHREEHLQLRLAASAQTYAGLKLRPGTLAALLGLDPRDVPAAPLPWNDLRAGRARDTLHRASDDCAEHSRRFEPDAADRGLLAKLFAWLESQSARVAGEQDLALLRATERRWVDAPDLTPAALAAELGLSLRTFERRLSRRVGLSPARFRQILRFFVAYRRLRSPQPLTGVAHDSGYADQSHFIRDFRRFTGLRPGDARRSPDGYGLL